MGICPKVNVMARLEYERAYYDSAVHRFNHHTTRTPPYILKSFTLKIKFQWRLLYNFKANDFYHENTQPMIFDVKVELLTIEI